MERISGDTGFPPSRGTSTRDLERFIGKYSRVFSIDPFVMHERNIAKPKQAWHA